MAARNPRNHTSEAAEIQRHEPEVALELSSCPRCGQDHGRVAFRHLERSNPSHTHWAICPKTGEPVMLVIMGVKERVVLLPR